MRTGRIAAWVMDERPSNQARLWPVAEIFLVGHLLHPDDVLAVERFLDGDVSHRAVRRRPVPVLMPRGAPQYVANPELELRSAIDLRPADAFGDDQRLPERMPVPGDARGGLGATKGTGQPGRWGPLELAGDGRLAGEIFGWAFDRLLVDFAGAFHRRPPVDWRRRLVHDQQRRQREHVHSPRRK